MTIDNPIICAIDTTDTQQAIDLIDEVKPHVGAVKLGLEFFVANGMAGVNAINELNVPLFLDLKFHDIPNTVAKAIEATAGMNCFMMTVHTAGGLEMMKRAVEASQKISEATGKERPKIIGVTVLTSLDQGDLEMLGCQDVLHEQTLKMAKAAKEAGLDGVVCSAFEASLIHKECGREFILVVPGIRPEGVAADDQKRIMTPAEAIQREADYLVVGRPITQAESPAAAAEDILKSLDKAEAA